jgi:PAS domain S-box-containing protein
MTGDKYKNLFDSAPFGHLVLDGHHTIRRANRFAARMLGTSVDDLRLRPIADFLAPKKTTAFETLCRRARESGEVESGDIELKCADGRCFDAHLLGAVLVSPAGGPHRFQLGLVDITSRKKSEAELGIERDNLTGILNAMEDGVYIVDQRHRIEYINPALVRQFGPVSGRPCFRYFHNRSTPCPWCKTREVLSGRTVRWEWYSEKTDKTYDLLDTPLTKPDGSTLKLEIFRDITQRKRHELALAESEERFRVAFETSPNATVISHIESGEIVDANAGFTAFTGFSRGEAIGRSSLDIRIWHRPEDRDKMIGELRRTGEVTNLETDFRSKNGELKTGLISARVITLHNRPHLLSVIRDIGVLKAARKKLQASHRFLQIANRHAEMTPLLNEFVHAIRELTGCGAVGIRILDAAGNIPFVAYSGFTHGFYETESPQSIHSAAGTCIKVIRAGLDPGQACVTPAGSFLTNASSRFLKEAAAAGIDWGCKVCNQYGYETLALIPIRLGGQILGLIHVGDPRPDRLPAQVAELLEDAALQLGAAIKRVGAEEELRKSHLELERRVAERTTELGAAVRELQRQIEEREVVETALRHSERQLRVLSSRLLSAEETERKRIAGELHDGIGQALSAIKFGVENALEQMKPGAGAGRQTLQTLIPFTRKTIDEVRRIVQDLRPSILDDLGVLATITWFCREFQALHVHIAIDTEISVTEADIPARLKTVIYRILQEALNNAAKHSRAERIHLAVRADGGRLEFSVRDNGIGFAVEGIPALKTHETGFGLASMRERAELSGGRFQLVSRPGQGTLIRLVWPTAAAAIRD